MEAVNKNGFVENIGKPNRIIFAGYIKKHSWSAGKVKLLFIQLVKARFKEKTRKRQHKRMKVFPSVNGTLKGRITL